MKLTEKEENKRKEEEKKTGKTQIRKKGRDEV